MFKQSFKVCFCFKIMFKLSQAEPPEEIKKIFSQYSEEGTMSIDQLHIFLTEFQGQKDASKEDAEAILDSLKHLSTLQRKGLHLNAFFRYLVSDLNLAISPTHGVHHDMCAPLAHYFIYTGHNSYLTGNQFISSSSTVPIIKALEKGVRVIELDLWPNFRGDEVIVRHGGTLTSAVELSACLTAIKENAFCASEYPVIITFEDHLPRILQTKVTKMVKEVFEEMLFCPEDIQEFPSPESLKRRIMISTKPPEYVERKRRHEINLSLRLKDLDEEEVEEEERNETQDGARDVEEDEDDDLNDAVAYRSLIAIHAGKPKGDVQLWFANQNKPRRLSLSEQQLEDIARTHGPEILRFTQRNLLRVYPQGWRVDSSNYNPMLGWMHGAQMIAYNMQGHGKYMRIMEGMFRANGGCGYVKKPGFLLSVGPDNEVHDPEAIYQIKKILKVTVYMGEGWQSDFHRTHFDLCSPPDFFVKIGIVGVPSDSSGMRRTRVVGDQWVPVWNEEFIFRLCVPELAFLVVKVLDEDPSGRPDYGGQTCLPVCDLRTGIRAVRLQSHKGEWYKSVRLLMRFQFV